MLKRPLAIFSVVLFLLPLAGSTWADFAEPLAGTRPAWAGPAADGSGGQARLTITDLSPADGATVPAGQDVTISAFIASESSAIDVANVRVLLDGSPTQVQLHVGSRVLRVGFTETRVFDPGEHTMTVEASNFDGDRATATVTFRAVPVDQEVTANVGDQFEIVLDANPSTGFSWAVGDWDESVLELKSSDFVPGGALPGAGGPAHWLFVAKGPGRTLFTLEYRRPWETDKPPARTHTVYVSVGG
ncbi:MAG: protease inhibitor I42 family protein [Chloroflexi bacterium]|nr:protease inhibitor I42 family protein [Chloroflexota bacterium]